VFLNRIIKKIGLCVFYFTLFCATVCAEVVEVQAFSSQKNITVSEPFWVAVRFKIQTGWHIYAPNSTQSFVENGIKGLEHTWHLPNGVQILETHWSCQKDFHQAGLTLKAFEKEAWVFVKMISQKPVDVKDAFSATFQWAACNNMCTLGQKTITFQFPFHADFLLSPDKLQQLMQCIDVYTPPKNILFWAWAFMFAFFGGLILNLMPCVLPILSMKLLHLMHHKQNLKPHGWVFAFGVWASFMVLGGTLMALRHFGHDMGWGFQLQSPLVVAILSIVFTLMALNLLGVFEVGHAFGRLQVSAKNPYFSSFMNGALTCIVATPCTAPFMGAALGAAMVYPWHTGLVIFSGLAVGVSLPFLLLCLWPKALAYVPKPGSWMITLKQFFSFSMWATVLWLVWVFGHQTSLNQSMALMCLILFVSLCVWVWGKMPLSLARTFVVLSSFALTVGGLYTLNGFNRGEETLVWEPYSEILLERLKNEGRTVFVDFTAKWCLTCQLNKTRVLENPEVVDFFQKKNIALLRADWTQKNPAITKALAQQGRNSIPLYVVYKGNQSTTLLPEILTIEHVIDGCD
jgi:thiol:disulfide interchange protein